MKISAAIDRALFDRDCGYYRIKSPIGKTKDFITAPEISQIFGELIAAYFLQIASSKKSEIALVEMGAGNGTMFFDILDSIKKLADKNNASVIDFLRRTTFHIIEISEELKKNQQQKLAGHNIVWHKNFSDFIEFSANKKQEIFFFCNELFDCFPIDQFVKTDIGWCERLIDATGDKPKFVTANFSLKNHQLIEKEIGIHTSEKAPFGAVFEYNKAAKELMSQLCEALTKCGGIAIIVDYGYRETEFANTLQAIKNHQKVDVLQNLQSADITALVDFGALEKITADFELNSSFVTQQEFLLALGAEERRQVLLHKKSAAEAIEINSAIDRLISPSQMGELFKVLMVWQ